MKNKKEYHHIAINPHLKGRFENSRFKIIGKEKKKITQEDLLKKLLDNFEKRK